MPLPIHEAPQLVFRVRFARGGNYDPSSNTGTAPDGDTVTLAPNGLFETYAYDSFGNMTSAGNFNFVQAYTPANQLSGWNYDPAGNLLTDALNNPYTYDAEGRVAIGAGVPYVYDAEGNRVEKSGSGATDYIYFGGQQLARLSGGQWTDLIYGDRGLLAEVTGTQTATPTFRLTDHLGSAVASVSLTGTLLSTQDYAPFGQLFNGGSTEPYKFTGKERDTESGLDYFGARYYASNMGRFLSPDNGEDQDAENPQSWNLYPYVLNNPLTNTDPDGHDCVVQSRVDNTTETVSVSSGTCAGVSVGSGQSATYVNGTVTGYQTGADGHSLDIGFNSYDGSSSGVQNAAGAPSFDRPGIDGPANAAIFGQIGNQGIGAIKAFAIGSVVGGVAAGAALGAIGTEATLSILTENLEGVLARAGSAIGNQGAKVASREIAEEAAKKWVGEGARPLLDRGTGKVIGEISADGTKIARWTSAEKAQPYINLVNKLTGSNLHVGW